jgi:hypothetical protein
MRRAGFGAASIGLLVACGSGPPAASAAPTATTRVQPVPSQMQTPGGLDTSGWKTYVNKRWGYSLKYPPTWYALGSAGGPDTLANIANQKVGSLYEATPGGIFLSIDVAAGATACFNSQVEPGRVERREAVTLAGTATDLEVQASGPGAHGALWGLVASALVSGVCYHVAFGTLDSHTRDAALPVAEAVVGSFTLLGG